MIIARGGSDDGRKLILLGLTAKNVEFLMAGKPMRITRESHGDGVPEDWVIGILYGDDEQAIADQITPFMAPDATVHL